MTANPLVQAVEHFTLAQLVADPNLCRNVLNDVGADAAEVFLLLAALDARVPQTLIEHTATNDLSVVEPRLVAELNQRGIERTRAQWAVTAWREVVGGYPTGQATQYSAPLPPVGMADLGRFSAPTIRPSTPTSAGPPSQPQYGSSQPGSSAGPSQPTESNPAASAPAGSAAAYAAPPPPYQPPYPPSPAAGPPQVAPARPSSPAPRAGRQPAGPVPPGLTTPMPSAAPPPRRSRGRAVALAVVATVIGLAVGAGAVWFTKSDKNGKGATASATVTVTAGTTATPSVKSSAALGAPKTAAVPATSAWTSTGIQVTKGQRLTISATGQIDLGNGELVGANGFTDTRFDGSSVVGTNHHGALIAVVGGSTGPFVVGSSFDGVAPASGQLYLGINDVGVENNKGAFSVTVRVQQ